MADWLGEGGVFQRVGDAIAGTDREAAFRAGRMQRAQYDTQLTMQDENRAQSEAAMATAGLRTEEARIAAIKKRAGEALESAIRESQAIGGAPLDWNDESLAGYALLGEKDYANLQTGRVRGQEYDRLAGIEDIGTSPAQLERNLMAQAPAAALNPTLAEVVGPEGTDVYALARNAPGQSVAWSPSQSGEADPRVSAADTNAIRGLTAPYFDGSYNPNTGALWLRDPTKAPDMQKVESLASRIWADSYPNMDHATAVRFAIRQYEMPGGIVEPAFPAAPVGNGLFAPRGTPSAPARPSTADPFDDYMDMIAPPSEGIAAPEAGIGDDIMNVDRIPAGARPVGRLASGAMLYQMPDGTRAVWED